MKKFLSKIITVFAAVALALSVTACGGNDKTTVRVYMPDGAPAVALARLMHDGMDNTEFTVVQASTIAARVSTGAADLAIMPVNAAATLYNKGTDIVMLTVNTHGNLFIVGDGDEIELSDLAGKRLGVIGMGNVPDQVMRMLLNKAGVEFEISENAVAGKVALRYAADGGELMPLLKTGKVDYALLAEPAVTTATDPDGNLKKSVVLDVQQAWFDEYEFEYPQACLIVRGEFLDDNKDYVDVFVDTLAASDGWAERNPDKALAAVKAHMESGIQSTLTTLTATTVENCNIRTDKADTARLDCDDYFKLLTMLETGAGSFALDKAPDLEFYRQA